jgi:hypothetical protein
MTAEKIYSFPVEQFPFQQVMSKILGLEGDLKEAHTLIEGSTEWSQITFENDTSTGFHTKYYKSPLYHEMITLYKQFLQEWLLPQLEEEEYIVQKEPSFRIHLPNNTALGKRDNEAELNERIGFHCDGEYNHPPSEMNYMFTITGQSDTNSCYVESEPGKEDFHPIQLEYGEVFRFYGNRCRHFNKKNISGQTRISFDFRVIPASKYEELETSAVHSGRKFVVGGYYMRIRKHDTSLSTTI